MSTYSDNGKAPAGDLVPGPCYPGCSECASVPPPPAMEGPHSSEARNSGGRWAHMVAAASSQAVHEGTVQDVPDLVGQGLASVDALLAPVADPDRCGRCGGAMIRQDLDGSVSCMMCGRPAVAPRAPTAAEMGLREGHPGDNLRKWAHR